MKFNLRALVPMIVDLAFGRPVSISTAASKRIIVTDAAVALTEDLILQPPEHPSFDISTPGVRGLPNAVQPDKSPPISTSDPLIAKEARGIGIPVVPPLHPLTPEALASAIEGHPMQNKYLGEFLDILLKLAENDKPQLLALIQAGEGGVEAFASKTAKAALQAHGGSLAGLLVNYVDQGVATLASKYGPEFVFSFIDTEGHNIAKSLGG